MLSTLVYDTLHAAGVPRLGRALGSGGLALCYHNVWHDRHTPVPGDPGLHESQARFEVQMTWLARHYDVIPLEEMAERIQGGRPLKGTVALTFDDGYDGVFERGLPVLKTLGLPATLFIVASAPTAPRPYWWDHPAARREYTPARREAWLQAGRGDGTAILATLGPSWAAATTGTPRSATWEAIAEGAGAGIDIGVHSLTHRTLTTLTDAELEREVHESRTIITERLGLRPTLFAYPYGRWDPRVRDAVRAAGYRAAVTLDRGAITRRTDPWSIPRLNIPAGLGLSTYACWLAGIRRPGAA